MLARLVWNAWPQLIHLPRPPKVLGLQAWATTHGLRSSFYKASYTLLHMTQRQLTISDISWQDGDCTEDAQVKMKKKKKKRISSHPHSVICCYFFLDIKVGTAFWPISACLLWKLAFCNYLIIYWETDSNQKHWVSLLCGTTLLERKPYQLFL